MTQTNIPQTSSSNNNHTNTDTLITNKNKYYISTKEIGYKHYTTTFK